MILEDELIRIKEYLLTEDLVDNKIGIGLGLKNGMSYEDLSKLILEDELHKMMSRRKDEIGLQLGFIITEDLHVPDDFRENYLKYLTDIIEQIHQTEMPPPKKNLIR